MIDIHSSMEEVAEIPGAARLLLEYRIRFYG
jgi:hypothetical protein